MSNKKNNIMKNFLNPPIEAKTTSATTNHSSTKLGAEPKTNYNFVALYKGHAAEPLCNRDRSMENGL